MRKIVVFNSVSLDGYFTDARGDMSWAHENGDDEWSAFTTDNARGDAALLFGRVTYEMMAGFWRTDEAKQMMPDVAASMNRMQKHVFSRTMKQATWANTTIVDGELVAEARRLKEASGPDLLVMGSGTIVKQLTDAGLIDAYQIVVVPVVLGAGRTMFDGVKERAKLRLTKSTSFGNGKRRELVRALTAPITTARRTSRPPTVAASRAAPAPSRGSRRTP